MTKPITGVALLTLYERGLFSLTDPVSRFIPEWRDLMVKERTGDGGERLVPPLRPMKCATCSCTCPAWALAAARRSSKCSRPTGRRAGASRRADGRGHGPRCSR